MSLGLTAVAAALSSPPLSIAVATSEVDADPRIADVEHDSREVSPGTLFACIKGETSDGHDFAAEAISAGAVALLVERRLDVDVPQLQVADVRRAVGPASAAVHGRPSTRLDLIGVTGTNGKTTTVRLVSDVLGRCGRSVLEIGTLTGSLTTPEATELQRRFAEAVESGADTVAMEVSSHALDQHRVDGSRFRVAAFTNLGRDHLDHHGTLEAYFAAKARLFEPDLTELAVIDTSSDAGLRLAAGCGVEPVEVDTAAVEVTRVGPRSSRFLWRGHPIEFPLGARFNVANAVLTAEIVRALGVPEPDIASALSEVEPVPGRFESIDEGQAFTVLVDYAHTPDALEAVLHAAREGAEGPVSVVFGAGGDRDREKRPGMGDAARRLADRVVVTSDNPRGEDPDAIIAAIIEGMTGAPEIVEPDRRLAIRAALAGAEPGEVVVIAGKGHEPTQTIGDLVLDLDDRVVVREELRRLGESR